MTDKIKTDSEVTRLICGSYQGITREIYEASERILGIEENSSGIGLDPIKDREGNILPNSEVYNNIIWENIRNFVTMAYISGYNRANEDRGQDSEFYVENLEDIPGAKKGMLDAENLRDSIAMPARRAFKMLEDYVEEREK